MKDTGLFAALHVCTLLLFFDVPFLTQVPPAAKLSDAVWSEKHQVCSSLARKNGLGTRLALLGQHSLGLKCDHDRYLCSHMDFSGYD